jgi:predicted DNA-binding mobile mystery protein A
MDKKALARKHLERRISPLRERDLTRPPRGWIRALRDSLGMTAAQLGDRIGVSQPRIAMLEKAEVSGNVTLASLRQAAEGLGCTFVYALVPNAPLDEILRERARRAAELQLARTHHTMKLENQELEPDELRAERERLVEDMLRGDLSRLWVEI